jgi:hypothetical protein
MAHADFEGGYSMTLETLRVQRHRSKMTAEGYARMEVTIGAAVIDRAREIAQRTGRPLWEVVQGALMAYLKMDYVSATGNAK